MYKLHPAADPTIRMEYRSCTSILTYHHYMAFMCRLHRRYCRRLHLDFHRPSTAILLVAGADAGPSVARCSSRTRTRTRCRRRGRIRILPHTSAYICIHTHTCACADCMRFDHFTGSSARTFVPDVLTQPSPCATDRDTMAMFLCTAFVFGYGRMPNEDGGYRPSTVQ